METSEVIFVKPKRYMKFKSYYVVWKLAGAGESFMVKDVV